MKTHLHKIKILSRKRNNISFFNAVSSLINIGLPVSNDSWAVRSLGETNAPNMESDLSRSFLA